MKHLDSVPILSGKEKAWSQLRKANPALICKNASVQYDSESKSYLLYSLKASFRLHLTTEIIEPLDLNAEAILKKGGYFFSLSAPVYLLNAKDIPTTGRLINPKNLKGSAGQFFTSGSHVLPVDKIAMKYGNDKYAFEQRCIDLGGQRVNYPDISYCLYPFARLPMTVILTLANDEFEANASILFDTSCEFQAPIDVIWSSAMMLLVLLL